MGCSALVRMGALAGLVVAVAAVVSCKRSCPPGQQSCGLLGTCTNTEQSNLACGSCDHACPSPSSCVAGKCVANCSGSSGDCDGHAENGCETDLSSSAASCGACGAVCLGTCKAGRCERFHFDGMVQQLVAGDDALYVETSDSATTKKKFFRAPWDGKDAALAVDAGDVSTASDLDPFVVAGNDLFFVSDDAVLRAPAAGGKASPVAEGLVKPRYVAATKDFVVFENGDWTKQSDAKSPTAVMAVPRAGGPKKELGRGWIGGVVADERYAYVTFVDEGLVRIDPATGARKSLVTGRAPAARLAGGSLYVVSIDGTVATLDRETGASTKLASLPNDVREFGFDGQRFVFMQRASTSTTVTPSGADTKFVTKISYDGKLVEMRASDGKTFDLLSGLAALSAKIVVRNGEAFCAIDGRDIDSVHLQ